MSEMPVMYLGMAPESIEALLDPKRELPRVWLKDQQSNPERVEFAPGDFDIICEGTAVGEATIEVDDGTRLAWFEFIEVDPDHHFGLATYKNVIKAALERGYTFRNHGVAMTDASIYVWLKLAKLGIAEAVEGFRVPLPDRDHYGRTVTGEEEGTKGYYRVKPLSAEDSN